ncbi:hypothetical protein BDN70DRAFT_993683 [Pholiota conissans]|uniref:F-box domain-containing protein n=1 Tax=Pholiota conissans TaxID=109636 RepID=A0A9P6D0A1_9AGAR|nr:hypothetical protein BDN70DRAFT_993683 [Pholiota conissans]
MYSSPVKIDSLPNELIAIIHEEAVLTYCEFPSTPTLDRATLASISLVCKRWRQNSVVNGKLWSRAIDVDHDSLVWVQEILQRTKASPLTINSPNTSYRRRNHTQRFISEPWQCIFENVALWGFFSLETDIRIDEDLEADWLSEGLRRPAPKLTSFTLSNKHSYEGLFEDDDDTWADSWDDEQFVLPEDMFARNAPRLTTFIIKNVYLPTSFNFSLWEHLTVLKVEQNLDGPDSKLLTHNWLDILRPLKLLERLDLDGTFNSIEVESSHNFETLPDVHLPHLSSLELGTGIEREIMFDIFAKLVVPSSCTISIVVSQWGHEDYPPFAFDRLKIGLDRHVRGLLADNEGESLIVNLENSLRGLSFNLDIRLENSVGMPYSAPNFEFKQRTEGLEDEESYPPIPTMQSLDTLPHAAYPNNPFSQLLVALGNVPACELWLGPWPRIVAEDIDPLFRFLAQCKAAEYLRIFHTDLVILDVLQKKSDSHDILFSNLQSCSCDPVSEENLPRVEAFRLWRESVGKLPARFMSLSPLPAGKQTFKRFTSAPLNISQFQSWRSDRFKTAAMIAGNAERSGMQRFRFDCAAAFRHL